MTGNVDHKLFLQKNLNQIAINRIRQEIDSKGKALPCRVVAISGSFVTVAFEVDSGVQTLPQITIPKAEGSWIRSPTQVGDFGLTIPADVSLAGVSGKGGVANMTRRANLTALAWVPIASTAFSTVNTNQAFVSGPQGVQLQTEDGSTSITIAVGTITLKAGGKTVTLNSTGLTIDGIVFDTHHHTGVQTGSGNTGGPA